MLPQARWQERKKAKGWGELVIWVHKRSEWTKKECIKCVQQLVTDLLPRLASPGDTMWRGCQWLALTQKDTEGGNCYLLLCSQGSLKQLTYMIGCGSYQSQAGESLKGDRKKERKYMEMLPWVNMRGKGGTSVWIIRQYAKNQRDSKLSYSVYIYIFCHNYTNRHTCQEADQAFPRYTEIPAQQFQVRALTHQPNIGICGWHHRVLTSHKSMISQEVYWTR